MLDSRALDELQQRAAEVQTELQAQQGEVVAAREALTAAERPVADAEAVVADAEGELAGYQDVVAGYAAAVYRDGGALTPLTLLLSGGDPGDVLSAMGFLEAVDAHAAEVIGAAEEQRQAAAGPAASARGGARRGAGPRRRGGRPGGRARGRGDRGHRRARRRARRRRPAAVAAPAGAGRGERADGGQLEGLPRPADRGGGRRRRRPRPAEPGRRAARRRWCPWARAAGERSPAPPSCRGSPPRCWCSRRRRSPPSPAAMEALGLPYAPGTAGPESWGCGSLVQSVYGAAGIPLPGDQADLFAVTTPVAPADVLPGDLVFLGDAESGLGHVGIALDAQTMLAADARAGAVVVRTLPADQVLGVGRPSLGQRAPVPAPGPTGGALRSSAATPSTRPSYDGARAWGGYPNGLIPPSAMCPLGAAGHSLRCDAAAAYRAMSAAFAGAFGTPICITDSYRTYASQVRLYGQKPALAAVPGTSNHGWGLAVDLCGGIQTFGTAQYNWLKANSGRFGFLHPDWAEPGNGREEPWHWEFAGT